jgi:DNA-binding response OmpR family regulator
MSYSAIILDLGLPDDNGIVLVRELRRRGNATPILILTARSGVGERVAALGDGADDYLTKPFAMEELIARMQALLRRRSPLLGKELLAGNVSLDTAGQQVTVAKVRCELGSRETALLEILLQNAGNVVHRDRLQQHLFGMSDDGASNAVEVYVHRLRKALEAAGATAAIHTIRGVGYFIAAKSPP